MSEQEVENAGRAPEAEPESGGLLGNSPRVETAFLRDYIASAMLPSLRGTSSASDASREDLAGTLLAVQESHAALEAKMADVEQANRAARDLYEQARAEALAAGYRERAAENRARILANQVDGFVPLIRAKDTEIERLTERLANLREDSVMLDWLIINRRELWNHEFSDRAAIRLAMEKSNG